MTGLNKQRGLIRTIIIIIVAAIVLGFFGFNLRAIVNGPTAQDNLGYVKELAVTAWEDYLSKPILYFWNNIFLGIIWDAFTTNMERIKNNQPDEIEEQSPHVPGYRTI